MKPNSQKINLVSGERIILHSIDVAQGTGENLASVDFITI